MATEWYSKEINEVLADLKTDPKGLTREEAERRAAEFGYNELKEKKRTTPLQIFLGQFKDVFVIMLLVATVISFLIGETVDAVTIAVIVILNSVVGFIQEYRSEKAMAAMQKLTAPKAHVLRDGTEAVIPAREIVPGEIVLLEAGDRVPADGRLLEVVDLKADEAVLTGESTSVNKGLGVVSEKTPVADRKNSVFMATHINYGRGKAVVTSTGMSTEFGKIAEMVQTMEVDESPLKKKLESFAKKLGIIIIGLVAVIFGLELYEIFILAVPTADVVGSILGSFRLFQKACPPW
jgi:Ca2+-transporting ATPase